MADAVVTPEGENDVVIAVHAQPGAGRTELVGRHGDALKIRVAVPPERGKANEALAAALADAFGVKAAEVTIVSGETSRTKRFKVAGVDLETAEGVLAPVLHGDGVPDRSTRDQGL